VATRAPVPGFLTVTGAAEQLHLAPRSVRDLIYSGRLPSVRLGRVHFMSVADVELERRRRLGLPLPPRRRRPRRERSHARTAPASPRPRSASTQSTRSQRAAERAALLERWLHSSHHADEQPALPFRIAHVADTVQCDVCQRPLQPGARSMELSDASLHAARLCLVCGRRAVLRWADERRRESIAARRLAADASVVEPATAA
jgi:hypothetical protein